MDDILLRGIDRRKIHKNNLTGTKERMDFFMRRFDWMLP